MPPCELVVRPVAFLSNMQLVRTSSPARYLMKIRPAVIRELTARHDGSQRQISRALPQERADNGGSVQTNCSGLSLHSDQQHGYHIRTRGTIPGS
jgi:hypothetical protein